MLMLMMAGCGGLIHSDKPAESTWWLEPFTESLSQTEAGPAAKIAVRISVVPGLDTDNILTLSDNAQLNHYSGARWADHLPELVDSLTTRTLQASGRYDVVAGQRDNLAEDCELRLEVREFFALLAPSGDTSSVRLAMDGGYWCDSGEHRMVKLEASIPVYEQNMSSIVNAFQTGMNSVMRDLLQQ